MQIVTATATTTTTACQSCRLVVLAEDRRLRSSVEMVDIYEVEMVVYMHRLYQSTVCPGCGRVNFS